MNRLIGADERGLRGYPIILSEYFTRIVGWNFRLCNIKCALKFVSNGSMHAQLIEIKKKFSS